MAELNLHLALRVFRGRCHTRMCGPLLFCFLLRCIGGYFLCGVLFSSFFFFFFFFVSRVIFSFVAVKLLLYEKLCSCLVRQHKTTKTEGTTYYWVHALDGVSWKCVGFSTAILSHFRQGSAGCCREGGVIVAVVVMVIVVVTCG